ncbi:MAG: hypothetical protein K0R34_1580 [Herbinix sp.]|jgi:hypothetical protein|nr:hypothetical protein [Herbinix sp.]
MDEIKTELYDSEQIKRVMKKTRNKMTMRIIRVFAICMAIVILLINTPNYLYYMQTNRITDAQKFMMLCNEFTTTNQISGFSVEFNNGLSFDRRISLYYRENVAGRNIASREQKDTSIDYNLLKRKLSMYYPINGTFMHHDRFQSLEAQYQQRITEDNVRAITAIKKNKDNTVSLLDLSFQRSYSMEEVIQLTDGLDLDINWFAIETGFEKLSPPSYIGMPAQQYYLWGFPKELYTPEGIFEPISLEEDNVEEHLKAVLSELKWMEDHSSLVDDNRLWFLDENIYDYLSETGFRCYGIQVNGPTDQIDELIQRVEYQYINILKMDLWYW